MIAAISLALSLAAAPAPAPKSVFFEQTATTTVDGKPGATARSRVYWRGDSVRLESGDELQPVILLLDLAGERAVKLDPVAKTATPLDMAALRSRTNLGFSMAGDTVGADEEDRFRTSDLQGAKTVAGYACEGHRIQSRTARVDVWTSTAVPVSMATFEKFLDWSGAMQSLGGLWPEIEKLKGFPLETRSRFTVNGHVYESTATVKSIKVDPLPASLFETPAGYRTVLAPEPGEE